MFSSRASLIPAMIDAAITSVEENLSLVRCSSSYLVACSRAIARFISSVIANSSTERIGTYSVSAIGFLAIIDTRTCYAI